MKHQLVSAEHFALILKDAHHPHIFADDDHLDQPLQHVIHNGVLYSTPLRGVA